MGRLRAKQRKSPPNPNRSSKKKHIPLTTETRNVGTPAITIKIKIIIIKTVQKSK